jgi:hypothetical protein
LMATESGPDVRIPAAVTRAPPTGHRLEIKSFAFQIGRSAMLIAGLQLADPRGSRSCMIRRNGISARAPEAKSNHDRQA